MSVMKIEEPRVLHALSGRVRVHIPEWSGQERRALEAQLRRMPGVLRIQTNALTGNVLLLFDAKVTDEQAVLRNVQDLIKRVDMDAVPEEERPAPAVLQEREGRVIRARVAVRGLDRDPEVAQRLLKRLEQYSGVRARVNVLTGRVLLEFPEHEADLDELIATVTGMDLPDLPEEDDPAHPLDPGPLLQSMIRTVGAALGLGLLATRRLFGVTEAIPGAGVAIQISSVIGILQGIPPLRYGLRRVLGRTVSDLLFNLPGIVTLTIAGSPLGLALTGGSRCAC